MFHDYRPSGSLPCPTSEVQATPIVVGGVMYVTYANECYALDAGSGRQIWHYQRSRTPGLGRQRRFRARTAALRSPATRSSWSTDNAHLIALNRTTGALLWETPLADWHENYNATGAPLVVGTMVVSGIAGGDDGARGFVAASTRHPAKRCGAFGPRRSAVSQVRRPGRALASIIPAALPG